MKATLSSVDTRMQWLAEYPPFQSWIDAAFRIGRLIAATRACGSLYTQHHAEHMEELSDQLFARTLSSWAAIALGLRYMQLLVVAQVGINVLLRLPMRLLWAAADRMYGTYIENLPLSLVFGSGYYHATSGCWMSALMLDVFICATLVWPAPRRLHIIFKELLVFRILSLLLSIGGLLALEFIITFAIGMIVAVLILYGVFRER